MQQRRRHPLIVEIDKIASEHAGISCDLFIKPTNNQEWDGLSQASKRYVAKIEALHKRQAFVCGPDGLWIMQRNCWSNGFSTLSITIKKRLVL
ncbi:hypothetical protein O9993_01070 [Vibrio lentus]|nr:hypothetical protein [Vibrio lentus]